MPFWFFPVQAGRQIFGALAGEGGKILLKLFHRLGVRADGFVDVRSFAEVVKYSFQAFKTETLNQELHDQGRFVVSELHVQIALRREERRAEFADRREIVAQNHFVIPRVHRLAPGWVGLLFLVNRDAFTEPARHLVARQPQRDDVTKLVPEHRFPVCRVRRLRGRAVRGDDVSEANAEKTGIVRQAEGAHGKILLFGKNLNGGWPVEVQSVLFRQTIPGALQQVQHTVAVNRRFGPAHPHDEVPVRNGLKGREGFAQCDQIVGRHIVTVPLMHLIRKLPTFILLAEAKQILRELDFCREKAGVELERPALITRSLREAIFLRELFADQMVHLGIRRPEFERLFARFVFGFGLVAQMSQHRAIGPRFRLPGIHGKRLVEHLPGGGVLLGIDRVIGQQQQGRHEPP